MLTTSLQAASRVTSTAFSRAVNRTFVGIDQLRSMPLTGDLEICVVSKPLCYASCVQVTRKPGLASRCAALNGLNDAQTTVALVAGACGSSTGSSPVLPSKYFTTSTRAAFYNGGFYASNAAMASGQKAAGYENERLGVSNQL